MEQGSLGLPRARDAGGMATSLHWSQEGSSSQAEGPTARPPGHATCSADTAERHGNPRWRRFRSSPKEKSSVAIRESRPERGPSAHAAAAARARPGQAL